MTIASCPSCHEQVTLPAGAQPDSIVRCPLCQEQFALREFLTQLPPELIVIDGPPSEPEPPATTTEWNFSSSSAAEVNDLSSSDSNVLGSVTWQSAVQPQEHATESRSDGAEEALPFDFTPGSAPQASVVLEPTPRAPRVQKKPAVEIAKIVAGGLLAIPLALLILLWLPGRWQRDPLQIGPSIGRVLPWLVPANCRPVKSSLVPNQDRSSSNEQPVVGRSFQSENPRATSSSPSAMTQKSRANAAPAQKATTRSKTSSASTSPRSSNASEPKPPAPSHNKASAVSKKPVIDKPSHAGSKDGADASLTDANGSQRIIPGQNTPVPPRTSKQLRAAMAAAERANDAWDARTAGNVSTENKLTDQLYGAFAQLGDVITFVNPQDQGIRDSVGAVQSLLMSLAMRPKKLAALGNRAAQWLKQEQRSSDGILLFGTVKKIRMAGQLFAMDLELAARQRRTISVISRADPKLICSPKDRVLVLGAIIQNPAANLPGYAGKQPFVVMAGFPPVPIGR